MTDQPITAHEKPQDEQAQDEQAQNVAPAPTPEPEAAPAPEPAAEALPPLPPFPQAPPQPQMDPWGAPVLPVEPGPKKPRRVLRAVLRWTAAVLVFGALGGAATYGVTQPERTKIPGLETPDDGRWVYQPLALPKLPAGKPAALDIKLNPGGRHYADPRSLLLPAPEGAKPDLAFPGAKGWLPTDTYLKVFGKDDQASQGRSLTQEGLRHIAARAWTMPDGTRAEIYLLQFSTLAYAERYRGVASAARLASSAFSASDLDSALDDRQGGPILYPFSANGPSSGNQFRFAYIGAGDTLGLVILSHKGTAPPVMPFRQTITLQAQLLG